MFSFNHSVVLNLENTPTQLDITRLTRAHAPARARTEVNSSRFAYLQYLYRDHRYICKPSGSSTNEDTRIRYGGDAANEQELDRFTMDR